MKTIFSLLGASCALVLALLCGSATATAEQATAQIIRADINGNKMHMYLGHDSLQSVINRTMTALDASGNGELIEWTYVLTNGNTPGMNVNYS